jgi:hypothetical protein
VSRYRRIETGTWTDQKYVELSAPAPNGRTLWHYLLTGQRTTVFPGLVLAKEIVMAADLEWPIDGHAATLRTAWAEIEAREMAIADWRTGVVVLPKSLLNRRGEPREASKPTSPNVFKGWARSWDDVPDCDLKAWYLAELGRFAVALDKTGKVTESTAYEVAFAKVFATHLERVRDSYPNAFASRAPTRSIRVQEDMFSAVNAFNTRSRVVPERVSNPRAFPVPVPVSEESERGTTDRAPFLHAAPTPLPAPDPSGPRVERVLPPAPRGEGWGAEKSRLRRVLFQAQVEIFNRVRIDIGADVENKASFVPAMRPFSDPAETALSALLDAQISFDGFEALGRHALAVRAEEATRTRSMKHLGKAVWGDAFGHALSRAVGEQNGAKAGAERRGPGEIAMDELRRLERLEAEGEQSR